MVHRRLVGLTLGMLVSWSSVAAAQTSSTSTPPEEIPPGETAGSVGVTAPRNPNAATYGAGARLRWVSVPHWLLGLFTKQNQSLSSYGFAAEGYRRKGDYDIMFSISYQKMGPPDGNWLGRGHEASIDTDFIQFRNFGLVGFDAAFIRRIDISEYVAFRYGAGLGVAIVTGQMLRTSAANCNDRNLGDVTQCKPIVCRGKVCTEAELAQSSRTGSVDTVGDPHRYPDDNVPGAVPILNVVAGLDFHIPQVKGLELRAEAGFYDAFFLGMAAGYLF
jgi:hypothetical protein